VPPHVFAVDSERLRYAQFARRGTAGTLAALGAGGLELLEYHEEPLPAELFLRGPLGGGARDPAALRAAVATLVARVATGVERASLVLPETWLRLVASEVGELPRQSDKRDEILRWKLKRLVPFRVDDLRLGHLEVPSLPGQEEPFRILIGLANEVLVSQLEDSFAAAGVHLGQVANSGLSVLAGVRSLLGDGLCAVLAVEDRGYTLVVAAGGQPLLHRHKAGVSAANDATQPPAGPPAAALPGAALPAHDVVRELRLTRTFLAEQLPDAALERVLLVAPEAVESAWLQATREAFGAVVESLRREQVGFRREGPPVPWRDLLPMLGAAGQEFA
jgi:hypothetical protein